MNAAPLHLFRAVGVELEYMIVDRQTMAVRPLADTVLLDEAGRPASELPMGQLAWSNELTAHVIELKTNGPAPLLNGLHRAFAADISRVNALLAPRGGRLMPTGAHPFMDPATETTLWPHEYGQVYAAYDRVFGCKGHGWANLQSMHLNLPFSGDDEFGRLHAAIRALLPLLPALAASTPILDGRPTGALDSRMAAYGKNSRRVPAVTGRIVPEPAYTEADYRAAILEPMYRDMAPLDPEGVLRDEFLNSRGAIARFSRGAIEIRVLDMQECPRADLALAGLITATLKNLVNERWSSMALLRALDTDRLAAILARTTTEADAAVIHEPDYLRLFDRKSAGPQSALDLWRHMADGVQATEDWDPAWNEPLALYLDKGCLARRMLDALSGDFRPGRVRDLCASLCDCLCHNTPFYDG